LRMAFGEALGESAGAIGQVPVERIHDLRALRCFQAKRRKPVHAPDKSDQLLLLGETEFGRLFHQCYGVVAGVRDADDVRPGRLRLQEKRCIVSRSQWMTNSAEDL